MVTNTKVKSKQLTLKTNPSDLRHPWLLEKLKPFSLLTRDQCYFLFPERWLGITSSPHMSIYIYKSEYMIYTYHVNIHRWHLFSLQNLRKNPLGELLSIRSNGFLGKGTLFRDISNTQYNYMIYQQNWVVLVGIPVKTNISPENCWLVSDEISFTKCSLFKGHLDFPGQ